MVEDKIKIALVSHAFNIVDYDVYLNHMLCIRNWSRKYDLVLVGKKGLDAAMARNQIIEHCFELGATHAFVLDADHMIAPEALDLLLESKNEAMISGLVCKKGEGYPQVGWLIKDGMFLPLDLPLDGNVYEVGVCAFGCTLINLEKIKKLEKPYFRDTCEPNAKGDLTNMRSDINLCLAFQKVKERCWIDTRVLIGHHGINKTVYPQNAKELHSMDTIETKARKLTLGQEGLYYEP